MLICARSGETDSLSGLDANGLTGIPIPAAKPKHYPEQSISQFRTDFRIDGYAVLTVTSGWDDAAYQKRMWMADQTISVLLRSLKVDLLIWAIAILPNCGCFYSSFAPCCF